MESTKKQYPFLKGGGEMGELVRNYDWSTTSLNTPDTWPQSLLTTLSIVLNSKFPMFLFWGPELLCFYNDAYRPSLGQENKHPATLGKPGAEVWPEIWAIIKPQIDQVMAGEEATWHEDSVGAFYRNGRLEAGYWTYSYSPVRDESGQVAGVFVTCMETTQAVENRLQLQTTNEELRDLLAQNQQLRQQERLIQQRIMTLFEESPMAIATIIGQELKFGFVNSFYCQIVGRSPDQLIGKALWEAIPETQGQGFDELLWQVMATGQACTIADKPTQLIRQGRLETIYLTFTYQPQRETDGRISGVLVVAIDVTEQVRARQIIQVSEDQKTFLLQLTDQLRSLDDPEEVFYRAACLLGTYLNADRVGYAEDQGDGETIVVKRNYTRGVDDLAGRYQYADYGPLLTQFLTGTTVVRPDIDQDPMLTDAEKEAHRLIQLGATVNKPLLRIGRPMIVLFMHYQQAHAWTEEELTLLDEVASRIILAVERVEAEQALRESEQRYRALSEELEQRVFLRTGELETANQDLKRSNENLHQFAYVASHDLQEPLRKIQSFGTLLAQRYGDHLGADGLALLERLTTSGARMSQLVRDLLTYSRVSTRQQDFGPVSLNAIITDALQTFELAIKERGAQLRVDELPVVKGDELQLGQLFTNLLGNALKFTPAGQAPQIQIQYFKRALAELPSGVPPTSQAQHFHQISITDQGVGFNMQYRDRIFQVFQRLHGKDEFPGTGVGLAICQRVVENHGGAITANSQPHQGATFCVYLPA